MADDSFNPFLDDDEEELASSDSTVNARLPMVTPTAQAAAEESVPASLTDEALPSLGALEEGSEQPLPSYSQPGGNVELPDSQLKDFNLGDFDFTEVAEGEELDESDAALPDFDLTDFDFTEPAAPPAAGNENEESRLGDFDFTEISGQTPAASTSEVLEDEFDLDGFDFSPGDAEDAPLQPTEEEVLLPPTSSSPSISDAEADELLAALEDFDFTGAQELQYAEEEDEDGDEEDEFELGDFDFTAIEAEAPAATDDLSASQTSPTADDWGFDFEDEPAPDHSLAPDEWDDEDEVDEDSPPDSTPQSADERLSSWGEIPADLDDELPEEEEDEEDLASYLADLEEDKSTPPESDKDKQVPAWKIKVQDTLAQIKSELRGGDEAPPPREASSSGSGKGGAILGKLFSPYTWLASKVLGILLLLLGPLKKIPGIGKFIGDNKVFRAISYLLPLILLAFILNWQGSKPLPPAKAITFPDGGAAAIGNFGYDRNTDEAYGTVVNKGEVIANITPTFKVYSIQPSLNPLSFFFAKPGGTCKGEEVSVPIGGKVKVKAKCDVKGSPKKITGAIKW